MWSIRVKVNRNETEARPQHCAPSLTAPQCAHSSTESMVGIRIESYSELMVSRFRVNYTQRRANTGGAVCGGGGGRARSMKTISHQRQQPEKQCHARNQDDSPPLPPQLCRAQTLTG